MLGRITKSILRWIRSSNCETEISHTEETETVVEETIIDEQGDQTRCLSNQEFDLAVTELTDEEILNLISNHNYAYKKRQVINPDHLPYDRKKGF